VLHSSKSEILSKDASDGLLSDNSEYLEGNKNMSSNTSLCVKGDGGYCQLDKGSGLLRWREGKPPVLLGFANRVTEECSEGHPYVFANIAYHVEWILSQGVLEDICKEREYMFECGIKADERVNGIGSAEPGEYPYAVSIRPSGGYRICQGVLISRNFVLTAASCVDKKKCPTCSYEAFLGGLKINTDVGGKAIEVDEIIYHPSFEKKKGSVNLALLHLEKEAPDSPIRLPLSSECFLRLALSDLVCWRTDKGHYTNCTRLEVVG